MDTSVKIFMTLKDWNRKFYVVKKGEKANAFTKDGIALFHQGQIEEQPKTYRETGDYDLDDQFMSPSEVMDMSLF